VQLIAMIRKAHSLATSNFGLLNDIAVMADDHRCKAVYILCQIVQKKSWAFSGIAENNHSSSKALKFPFVEDIESFYDYSKGVIASSDGISRLLL
jgi:hypothetical protein